MEEKKNMLFAIMPWGSRDDRSIDCAAVLLINYGSRSERAMVSVRTTHTPFIIIVIITTIIGFSCVIHHHNTIN